MSSGQMREAFEAQDGKDLGQRYTEMSKRIILIS